MEVDKYVRLLLEDTIVYPTGLSNDYLVELVEELLKCDYLIVHLIASVSSCPEIVLTGLVEDEEGNELEFKAVWEDNNTSGPYDRFDLREVEVYDQEMVD